jgi:hypothetical protein
VGEDFCDESERIRKDMLVGFCTALSQNLTEGAEENRKPHSVAEPRT